MKKALVADALCFTGSCEEDSLLTPCVLQAAVKKTLIADALCFTGSCEEGSRPR